jgi:copper chaperone CopZ
VNCPHCGNQVTPCISAQEGMQVRAWWCQACNWSDRAIGRERLIVDPVQASIEAFVEMRVEGNG